MRWGVSRVSSCWPVKLVVVRLSLRFSYQTIIPCLSRTIHRLSRFLSSALYYTNPCQRRSSFLWLWVLKTWGQQWFVTINAYSISVTLTRDTCSSSVTWSEVQKSCVWENTTWNMVFLVIVYLMMTIAWPREALLWGWRLYSRILSSTP